MITGIIGVSAGAEFEIMEQRLQIVWRHQKGSTMTPNVGKWPADIIRDYSCQLSHLASDCMIESERCEGREPSALTLFNSVKQVNESGSIANERIWMIPHDGIRSGFWYYSGHDVIRSRDSQDPRGYRMDRLGTLRRLADPACIYRPKRFK